MAMEGKRIDVKEVKVIIERDEKYLGKLVTFEVTTSDDVVHSSWPPYVIYNDLHISSKLNDFLMKIQ